MNMSVTIIVTIVIALFISGAVIYYYYEKQVEKNKFIQEQILIIQALRTKFNNLPESEQSFNVQNEYFASCYEIKTYCVRYSANNICQKYCSAYINGTKDWDIVYVEDIRGVTI